MLTLFIQQVLNGLLDGVYYLLIALGLSLIFSLGGIVNLAHGAFYAIGAYLTIVLAPHIGFGGAMVASPVLVALIGIVVERGLFQRFYRSDPILSLLLTFGLAILVFSFGYAAANAVWPSFYAEMFSTKVRFSGLAIGTQLGFLMAGFAPAIVAAMGGIKPGGWVQISIFTAVICGIAAVSAMTAKESFRTPTKELGLK